ncbi:MAG: hypothetical protein H0W81_02090 [Chloroflexi bacterium]|nr:hypothetical protein [Chloroflexota bacterium]
MLRRFAEVTTALNAYVPILLVKRGERIALQQTATATAQAITPWLRIVPPELRGDEGGVAPAAELARLAAATGDRALYLDAVGTPRRRRRIAPLGGEYMQDVYEAAVASNLAFLPVYPFGRPDLADIVRRFASDDLGAALLVRADAALAYGSRQLADDLRVEVATLGVDPERLDLMLDLGYIPPGMDEPSSVVRLALQAVSAARWRTVILAGTSVPDSLAEEIADDSLNAIARREVALFDKVQAHLAVRLRFADYAAQHPVPPPPGAVPKMRPSIRYTAGEFMYVSRGRPMDELDHDEVPVHYRALAERLRMHPPFVGSACCWGDRFIEELADGARLSRSQYWMRAVATCHHLAVVAEERSTGAARARVAPLRRARAARVPATRPGS